MSTMTVESVADYRASAIEALPSAATYIAGEWVAGDGDGRTHVDPATGQELRAWALGGSAAVRAAVESAARAQISWAAIHPAARRDLILALADTMAAHANTLAALVSLEMGMPLKASRAGAHAAVDWYRYYAGYADKIEGSAPSVVLDYLWASAAEIAFAALARRGLEEDTANIAYVQIGAMAGPEAALPAALLRSRRIRISGSGAGSAALADVMAQIPVYMQLIADRKIDVPTQTFALSSIAEAWTAPAQSTRRMVIVP